MLQQMRLSGLDFRRPKKFHGNARYTMLQALAYAPPASVSLVLSAVIFRAGDCGVEAGLPATGQQVCEGKLNRRCAAGHRSSKCRVFLLCRRKLVGQRARHGVRIEKAVEDQARLKVKKTQKKRF